MFEVIYRLFEMLALVLCLHSLSGEKAKPDIYNVGFIAMELAFMQMIQEGIVSKQMYFAVYLLYFVYAYIKFNDGIKRTMLKCLLVTIIIGGLQIIVYIAMFLLSPIIDNEIVTVVTINTVILLFLFFTRKSRKYERIVEFCSSNDWILRICILVCIGIIVYCMYSLKSSDVLEIDIFILFLILMSIVFIFAQRWQKSVSELAKKEKELEITNLYNGVFEELITTIRRRQHDFHNQIEAVYSMHLTAKSLEELVDMQKEYCDNLVYENRYSKVLGCTNNSTLAGFIYTKFINAEKHGIEVDYKVIYTGNIPISVYDLVEIIGILMDNAIEALAESELTKKIIFGLKDYEGLDLSIKNPVSGITNGDVEKFFQNGYTTKASGSGIGLSKIKEYQKKYKYNICASIQKTDDGDWLEIRLVENL